MSTNIDKVLGNDRWGLGPSVVALRIDGHWVCGARTNNLWSVSSSDSFGIESVPRPRTAICPHYRIRILRPCGLSERALYQARHGPRAKPFVHSSSEFSTRRHGTRANSRVLAVTSVRSAASACAAIDTSVGLMGVPCLVRW